MMLNLSRKELELVRDLALKNEFKYADLSARAEDKETEEYYEKKMMECNDLVYTINEMLSKEDL